MIEMIYRYDPEHPPIRSLPATADEAKRRLERGNLEFATLLDQNSGPVVDGSWVMPFDLEDIGIAQQGSAPRQHPFAAVLGCSDARVPTELIFNRTCNEMFVVRVAGNVLGRDGIGSLDYALNYLNDSLRLLVVLGHSHCGAVTAAADAFLNPTRFLCVANNHSLRSIVSSLFPAVVISSNALTRNWGQDVEKREGYRTALIETSVVLNAALTAAMLVQEMRLVPTDTMKVVFGVYDLVTRQVQIPTSKQPELGHVAGLSEPPLDSAGFDRFGDEIVHSKLVKTLLGV